MKRSYVLCNMVMTIDGKVTGNFLKQPENKKAIKFLFQNHENYLKTDYDAFALGRNSFELEFTNGYKPDYSKYLNQDIKYEDFIFKTDLKKYVVAFDRKGVLGWKENILKGNMIRGTDSHIIEILTEQTPKENLLYYKEIGVSYIFAGKEDIDINLALEKLKNLCGINKLILAGGSVLNGAFLKADCVDELALVICSTTGDSGDKTLFNETVLTKYKIKTTQIFIEDNMIYINYVKQ